MTIHRGRKAEKEKVFFLAVCVSCARRVFIYCTTWENENFAHKSQINSLMEQFEKQTKEKKKMKRRQSLTIVLRLGANAFVVCGRM